MRDGVSLAAALALTSRGDLTRPQVDLIVFLVFGAILGALVVQGLTPPLLIGQLGLSDDGEAAGREETTARLAATRAALARLSGDAPVDGASPEGIEYVRAYYAKRADHLAAHLDGGVLGEAADPLHDVRRLRREMIAVERSAAIGLRDRGVIGDETLRHRARP